MRNILFATSVFFLLLSLFIDFLTFCLSNFTLKFSKTIEIKNV